MNALGVPLISSISMMVMMMMILMTTFNMADSSQHEFFVSAGTKIVLVGQDGNQTVLHDDPYSRFVALAVDVYKDKLIFWSDMGIVRKGLYKATLNEKMEIHMHDKLDLHPPIQEVNSLAIDVVSNYLYWTDAQRLTVEMYSYKTNLRKIVAFLDLQSPRGISLDIFNGYLFWNDQKFVRIERSRLDGSERKVIIEDAQMPNHMVCHEGRLYWTNSNEKILESSDLDGRDRRVVRDYSASIGNNHIFGLAVSTIDSSDDTDDRSGESATHVVMVTSWNGSVFMDSIDVVRGVANGSPVVVGIFNSSSRLYGAVAASNQRSVKKLGDLNDPCKDSSCSQLCFNVGQSSKCACSSYGGLVLSGTSCVEPKEILLFAMGGEGHVAYLADLKWNELGRTASDVYFVAQGSRPVAVTYDPLNKLVYWSDVEVNAIFKTNLNGSRTEKILSKFLHKDVGIIDGLVFDSSSDLLFFTNIGSINGYGNLWRKIEAVNPAMPERRRTIVTRGDMLRALAVDSHTNSIYYSDWGEIGSIMQTNLNGSKVKVIRSGLDNPNGLLLINNHLYFIDSHFKDGDKKAAMYKMSTDGRHLQDIPEVSLETPFGMTTGPTTDIIIIGDWGQKKIMAVKTQSSSSSSPPEVKVIFEGIDDIMGLHYTPVHVSTARPAREVEHCNRGCSGVCLKKSMDRNVECLTNTYNRSIADLVNYVAVSDLGGIEVVNLARDPTDVFPHIYSTAVTSGVSALAIHDKQNVIFYQDPSSNWIWFMTSSTKKVFYKAKHPVNSMVVSGGYLFWADSGRGLINSLIFGAALDLPFDGMKMLVKDQVKPRGLKYHQGSLYWIEGSDTLRIATVSIEYLDMSHGILRTPEFVSHGCTDGIITWSSSFHLDEGYLYLTGGIQEDSKLVKCSLDGSTVTKISRPLDHPSDIYVLGGHLLYTDWKRGSLKLAALDSKVDSLVQTLAEGFSRPMQVSVHKDRSRPVAECSAEVKAVHCPDGLCVPLSGQLVTCSCPPGMLLEQNTKRCIDPTLPQHQCGQPGSTVNYGDELRPNKCRSCRCQGRSQTVGDSHSLEGLVCKTVQCPTIACEVEEVILPGECCPVCPSRCTTPTFVDCPTDKVVLQLPPDQSYIIHDFVPRVVDCPNVFRNIDLKRIPATNIIQWQKENLGQLYAVKYIASALNFTDEEEEKEKECAYYVHLADVTPPTITCPNDITIQTLEAEVHNVYWMSPKVKDNSGDYSMECSRIQGSSFIVGTHVVTCDVKDAAGNLNKCYFNVNVEKIKDSSQCEPDPGCTGRQIMNGHLDCSCSSRRLHCAVVCDEGFVVHEKSLEVVTCDDGGQWSPKLSKDFETSVCIKLQPKTFVQTLELLLRDQCKDDIDTNFTQDYVGQRYLNHLHTLNDFGPPIEWDVQVEKCKENDTDLVVSLRLTGKNIEDSDEASKRRLGRIMSEVQLNCTDPESDFFAVLSSHQADQSRGVHDVLIQDRYASRLCPRGEIPHKHGCATCPPGTYWNVPHTNAPECSSCPNNTYNPYEGRDRCLPCGEAGDDNDNVGQCIVAAGETSTKQAGNKSLIVAIVCASIGVLFVIGALFLAVRHCRKTGKYSIKNGHLRGNGRLSGYEVDNLNGGRLDAESGRALNSSRSFQGREFETRAGKPLIT